MIPDFLRTKMMASIPASTERQMNTTGHLDSLSSTLVSTLSLMESSWFTFMTMLSFT